MTDKEILSQLNELFSNIFDEDIVLGTQTSATEIDGWDSLAHVRLMLAVERAFKIKFSAAQVSNLKNVGELVGLIQSKI